jgi:hypothetical protein
VRVGSDRTGPVRFGPVRFIRTGSVRGLLRWQTADCGVGRHPLVLPGGAHPLFLTGGWAQQQGEEEEGGQPLFVPGEGDEQGKGTRGEEMVGERDRDIGKGRPSGQPRTQKSGMW